MPQHDWYKLNKDDSVAGFVVWDYLKNCTALSVTGDIRVFQRINDNTTYNRYEAHKFYGCKLGMPVEVSVGPYDTLEQAQAMALLLR